MTYIIVIQTGQSLVTPTYSSYFVNKRIPEEALSNLSISRALTRFPDKGPMLTPSRSFFSKNGPENTSTLPNALSALKGLPGAQGARMIDFSR
jgi:hypothetical protein